MGLSLGSDPANSRGVRIEPEPAAVRWNWLTARLKDVGQWGLKVVMRHRPDSAALDCVIDHPHARDRTPPAWLASSADIMTFRIEGLSDECVRIATVLGPLWPQCTYSCVAAR